MKNKLIIIIKIILMIIVYVIVNIILRIGPQVIVGLLETCCNHLDIELEFKKHIFLFASYGICDFIAILMSLGIFNRKKNINSKIAMFIFLIILILNSVYCLKDIYVSHNLVLLGNLNIYLVLIVILSLIINSILIRKNSLSVNFWSF